jgi:DnaK suppressor protein
MLSDANKEHFKTLLNHMLNELLQGGRQINPQDADFSINMIPDPSDRATAEISMNLSHTLQERNKGLIRKIEAAIDRIENGTFGICDECEEYISVGRLNARPISTLCIDCKRAQEEKEVLSETY